MTQLDLLGIEQLPPHQAHSATSKAAAVAIVSDRNTLRKQVYEFIKSKGLNGATDEEIQDGLGMNPSTQRPRRVELWTDGKIVKNGECKRPTKSGRLASVWQAWEDV